MEDSLGRLWPRHGAEYDIRARIDRKSGELFMTRYRHVVEEVENHFRRLTLRTPGRSSPCRDRRDFLTIALPPMVSAASPRPVSEAGHHRRRSREADARAAVRGSRTGRRDHQRRRQAHRIIRQRRRCRPGRGDPAPRPADPARGRSNGDQVRADPRRRASETPGPADLPPAGPAHRLLGRGSSQDGKCRDTMTASAEDQGD